MMVLTADFPWLHYVSNSLDTNEQNRISNMTFFCVSKEKLCIVFVDGWYTGEYNFVINNYLLPKDISEKT